MFLHKTWRRILKIFTTFALFLEKKSISLSLLEGNNFKQLAEHPHLSFCLKRKIRYSYIETNLE